MRVVLNAKAGTVRDLGPERVRRTVDAALTRQDRDVEVVVAQGHDMTRLISSAPREGYDTVVVGAGDGTVSYAASVFANTDVTLGVLPLGTMNLLAYDIGLPRDLPGALAALNAARPMKVDVGMVNGRPFHGVSGLGFFSQMALAREQLREQRGRVIGWVLALGKALLRSGRISLEVEVAGVREPIEAYAALVTVNAFDAPGWHRSRLDGGLLEVLVAEDRGTLARLKTGAEVLVDAWRDKPGIRAFTARRVTIHARRRRAWVATDGEVTREGLPLRYAVAPGALNLLVPPDALQWRNRRADDVT
ncbi:diacylglycerol/lipid kinase family protein [Xanthobacter sp. AM11]|uniref:diacylglycerol/lipid kinase family protein n=1 Tax=Xanthobacter sp. AM11 TaxID=3380643 RepID=UPI0039BF03D4